MTTPAPAVETPPSGRSALHPRGILTLAAGSAVYIAHARALALSFRRHNPDLPCAVITDSPEPALQRLFTHVIPLRREFGTPFRQKLSVNLYSPFAETLFIDSDCLIVKDLQPLFPVLRCVPVAVVGGSIRDGHWYTDVARFIAQLGVPALPKFNGGLFYFRRDPAADAVFATARDVLDRHVEYGLAGTHGDAGDQVGDEPALAAALALHGISAVDDQGLGQASSLDSRFRRLEIDVLRGRCQYIYTDQESFPSVAHFIAHAWRGPIYRREYLKLRLAERGALPAGLISWGVNVGFPCVDTTVRGIKWALRPLARRARGYLRRKSGDPVRHD